MSVRTWTSERRGVARSTTVRLEGRGFVPTTVAVALLVMAVSTDVAVAVATALAHGPIAALVGALYGLGAILALVAVTFKDVDISVVVVEPDRRAH